MSGVHGPWPIYPAVGSTPTACGGSQRAYSAGVRSMSRASAAHHATSCTSGKRGLTRDSRRRGPTCGRLRVKEDEWGVEVGRSPTGRGDTWCQHSDKRNQYALEVVNCLADWHQLGSTVTRPLARQPRSVRGTRKKQGELLWNYTLSLMISISEMGERRAGEPAHRDDRRPWAGRICSPE